MRVLAAEDNKTNRLVFAKLLQSLDIELSFARDGGEAVDLFGTTAPDLVFMDISMPVVDGKTATAQIRRLESAAGGARVPIVAMTAHALTGDRDAILAAGLDHYLTKPMKKEEIVAQIVAHCPPGCRPPLPDPVPAAAAGGT